MQFKYDPAFSIWKQISAFRINRKVSQVDVDTALTELEHEGIRLEDLQGVLGSVIGNWGQEHHQILVGFAIALRKGWLTLRRFEAYAHDIWLAMQQVPCAWDPDISAADALRINRAPGRGAPGDTGELF